MTSDLTDEPFLLLVSVLPRSLWLSGWTDLLVVLHASEVSFEHQTKELSYDLPAQVVVVVGEDLFSGFDDPYLMYR